MTWFKFPQYVWYIMWLINLPLLLLSVLLVTGLSLLEILVTLFAAVVLVLASLVGDYVPAYGRSFAVLAGLAFAYVMYVTLPTFLTVQLNTHQNPSHNLLIKGTKSAYAAGDAFGTRYLLSAAPLTLVLLGYPSTYFLAHTTGPHALVPEVAVAAYGALDVLAQPVFLLFFLHQLSKIDAGSICGAITLGGEEDEELACASPRLAPRRLRRSHGAALHTY